MARSFLIEAKLPKKFWRAIREADFRLNILPITHQQDGTNDPAFMSTPHFVFLDVKRDYRILFPFGCIGAFHCPRDGNHTCNTFESQCMLGIAFGRSEYTNSMVFIISFLIVFLLWSTVWLIRTVMLVKFSLLSNTMGD